MCERVFSIKPKPESQICGYQKETKIKDMTFLCRIASPLMLPLFNSKIKFNLELQFQTKFTTFHPFIISRFKLICEFVTHLNFSSGDYSVNDINELKKNVDRRNDHREGNLVGWTCEMCFSTIMAMVSCRSQTQWRSQRGYVLMSVQIVDGEPGRATPGL